MAPREYKTANAFIASTCKQNMDCAQDREAHSMHVAKAAVHCRLNWCMLLGMACTPLKP